MTEWSVSHEKKKKHIVTKDVVGLLLGEIVSTKVIAHFHRGCGWLALRKSRKYGKKTHRHKGCGWLTSRR